MDKKATSKDYFKEKFVPFINSNLAIIVVIISIFSFLLLFYKNGFELQVNLSTKSVPESILIQEGVPVLKKYYARDRVNVTLKLVADDSLLDEGEVLDDLIVEKKYNERAVFSVPTREKHLFSHWSSTPNGDPLDPATRITEETTLYANWIDKPVWYPYQVLLKVIDKVEVSDKIYGVYRYHYYIINKGSSLKVEHNEYDDYVSASENKTLLVNVGGNETNSEITREINYNKISRKTVTVDLNGGNKIVPSNPTVFTTPTNGSIPTLLTVRKEGHYFAGWSYSSDGPVMILEDQVVDDDITIYAIFKETPMAKTKEEGRYSTEYYMESTSGPGSVIFYTNYQIGTIGDMIVAEELENLNIDAEHLFQDMGTDYLPQSRTFVSIDAIINKQDKIATLQNKVLSITKNNYVGILGIVLLFAAQIFLFVEIGRNKYNYLIASIMFVGVTVIFATLLKTIKFSDYYNSLLRLSVEINPETHFIKVGTPLILATVLAGVVAVLTFAAFIINVVFEKKTKDVENQIN